MSGEYRAAATPLDSILSQKRQPKLSYKSSRLVNKVYDTLNDYIISNKSNKNKLHYSINSYPDVTDRLDKYEHQKVFEQFKDLDETEALEYGTSANRGVDYLKAQKPGRVKDTLMGPVLEEPADHEKISFLRRAAVVDDPLLLFNNLGQTTSDELDALKEVYPHVYQIAQRSIVDILTNNKDLKLDPKKEKELSKILNIPFGQDYIKALQATYANEQAKGTQEVNNPTTLTPGQKQATGIIGDI